jgi:Glycosyl hydrolases family 39
MKRFLPVLLVVLAVVAPATASATTFGAQVGVDFLNQARGAWSPQQVMSSLKALHAAGGRVGRADSDWAGTEPRAPVHGRHRYHWAYDDMIIGEMAKARLSWEPTLELAPKWAQARRPNVLKLKGGRFVTPLPPAKNATFATYATAFMRRYGAHGAFWATHRHLPYFPVRFLEVWNEPDNTHFWGPHIDLQDYASLYETVRAAVRRVNPGARVVTGGLAWTQSSLPRLLKAFNRKPVDAVAVHVYAPTPRATIFLARYALAQMQKYGRGSTPLVVNEYGWTSRRGTWGFTNPRHVSRYAYQALLGLSNLRIAQILPFEWTDPSWGLSDGTYARAVALISQAAR